MSPLRLTTAKRKRHKNILKEAEIRLNRRRPLEMACCIFLSVAYLRLKKILLCLCTLTINQLQKTGTALTVVYFNSEGDAGGCYRLSPVRIQKDEGAC